MNSRHVMSLVPKVAPPVLPAYRCLAAGLVTLVTGLSVGHFFQTGSYWHDSGWFSYLLDANPFLSNPDGSSFFEIHVSPALSIVSWLNSIAHVPRPIPLLVMLIASYIVIVTGTFRLLRDAPSQAVALTMLLVVATSSQVFAFYRFPHYELLALALFVPFWFAVVNRRRTLALAAFTAILLIREDMGLHVGLLVGAYSLMTRFAGTARDADAVAWSTTLFRLALAGLLYSMLAFTVQYLFLTRSSSMVERAIIGSGEQMTVMRIWDSLRAMLTRHGLELLLVLTIASLGMNLGRRAWGLVLLGPYALWTGVCSLSQNPVMATQDSYYSFPLFFVLFVCVTSFAIGWEGVGRLSKAIILAMSVALLWERALDLRTNEVQVWRSVFSRRMKTFENIGAWRKLSRLSIGPDVRLSYACASLWVTPETSNRTIDLEKTTVAPAYPVLLMEHELGADQFFRTCTMAPGEAYTLNNSSFILWVPTTLDAFADQQPAGVTLHPFNMFIRTLTVAPPSIRTADDIVIAAGQSGCCIHGPYLTLPAGRYTVRGRVTPVLAERFLAFDCARDGGHALPASIRADGDEFVCDFDVGDMVGGFEFRCWSEGSPMPIRISTLRLEKAGSAGPQPEHAPVPPEPQ